MKDSYLKQIRKQAGLTLKDLLPNNQPISQVYLSTIEAGQRPLTRSAAYHIVKSYHDAVKVNLLVDNLIAYHVDSLEDDPELKELIMQAESTIKQIARKTDKYYRLNQFDLSERRS